MACQRKQLLFVTPVEPAETGNGLAMRCGAVMQSLSASFDVHLFVVPLFPSPGARPEFIERHSVRTGRLNPSAHIDPLFKLISTLKDPRERERAMLDFPKPQLSRFVTSRSSETMRQWYGAAIPDAVHVTRLYLAPLGAAFRVRGASSGPFSVLDMDEDEVVTRRRLAALYGEYGDCSAAARELEEAKKYEIWTEQHLGAYDRVVLSAADDAQRLHQTWQDMRFDVVPNALGSRPVARLRPLAESPSRLLFVGNLSYLPNEDAVVFLIGDVLPRLRELLARPVVVDIVGGGARRRLRRFECRPDVRFHGYVRRLGRLYHQAQAAVVPIRAGGGTRLKILEAFSYGLPVVSTSIGAEGLNAVHRRHLLFADDAASFAARCAELLRNARLADAIRCRAASLLRSRFGLANVKASLNHVYADVL